MLGHLWQAFECLLVQCHYSLHPAPEFQAPVHEVICHLVTFFQSKSYMASPQLCRNLSQLLVHSALANVQGTAHQLTQQYGSSYHPEYQTSSKFGNSSQELYGLT